MTGAAWRPCHVVDALGGVEVEFIQHQLGLVGDLADPRGGELPIPQGVSQGCIGDAGHDGIRVRVPVTDDVDGFQGSFPLSIRRKGFPVKKVYTFFYFSIAICVVQSSEGLL